MAEEADFQGGGTRIDTLLRNQQAPQQQQQQYAQQQYPQQQHPQQQHPQQQHPQQQYAQQYAQQQRESFQQYPPPQVMRNESMRETFINKASSLNWKEAVIVFILTFLVMNYQVQSFIIPKIHVQYDWVVGGVIGSLVVAVLYLIMTYFVC